MLGYVSRSEFESERELRLTAEANAQAFLAQLTQANERINTLTALIESERKAHSEEKRDLLDRFVPKLDLTVPQNGVAARSYTSDVARNVRAHGKSDIRWRRSEIRRLENEEMSEDERADRKRRQDSLNKEERKGLSQSEGDLLDTMLANAAPKKEEATT